MIFLFVESLFHSIYLKNIFIRVWLFVDVVWFFLKRNTIEKKARDYVVIHLFVYSLKNNKKI